MATKSFYSLQSVSKIESGVYCQLLEIDSYKILVNCGADKSLNVEYLNELEEILPSIDCVLISHAELKYFGALFELSKKTSAKIMMTLPTKNFTEVIFREILTNNKIAGDQKHSEEDLQELYDKVTVIKYSQSVEIGSIKIVAQNSGHTLGGAIWQIQKDVDVITIAMDINHRKENHIDGFNMSNMKNSLLFLTNCDFVGEVPSSRKANEKTFHEILGEYSGKKIIFVCNTMRSLEICCVLNDYLRENRLSGKSAFCSFQSKKIHELLRGFLEWTGDIALKKFTTEKNNPFQFNRIKFCEQFNEIPESAEIFILPDDDLNSNFKNKLIHEHNESENLVVFFDEEIEKQFIESSSIDFPIFSLPEEETENLEETLSQQSFAMSKENTELNNFADISFLENKKLKKFPKRNKSKPKDLYGEFPDNNTIRAQIEEEPVEIVEEITPVEEKKEIVTIKRKDFKPEISTKVLEFNAIIDGKAMKDVLESIDIEKMILFGKEKVFVEFFRDICLFTKCIKEIVILKDQKVNLSSDVSISKVELEEDFLEKLHLKQVQNIQIAPFIGKIDKNTLYFARPYFKQFTFGHFDFHKLTQALREKNFKVQKLEPAGVLIDESIRVVQNDSEINIIADYSDKLVTVRNIIYENVLFIE